MSIARWYASEDTFLVPFIVGRKHKARTKRYVDSAPSA